MIHEGTHGIQAADLLGRKVTMEGGRGLMLLAGRIDATIAQALQQPELAAHANALAGALQQVGAATKAAWATGDAGQARRAEHSHHTEQLTHQENFSTFLSDDDEYDSNSSDDSPISLQRQGGSGNGRRA
jgi:hypothetical protein